MRFYALLLLIILIVLPGFTYGQRANRKITVTGRVTDPGRKPVAGAVIFVDKIKTDIVTDDQGYYRIRVSPHAKEILVFTLLSGAAEETINGRTTIDFILTGKSADNADKPANTDNQSGNNGKEAPIRKDINPDLVEYDQKSATTATHQSIYDMIRGRFPGVEVSGKSIKIMGSSSLNVSTEPLYVVDGVVVSSIEDISPQSVKSIEVLKGPDATVYGVRGSNGVIVITRITGRDKY